jgi:RNA-binding protein
MLQLTPAQRKLLKSLAHDLKPVVMIGSSGLTEAVLREAARSLDAHELIKIRVLNDDRALRQSYMLELCAALGAAPVQHIGKLLLIYRPTDPPRIQLP